MKADASTSGKLKVGELAKAVGKTVRAIHLYEELGLVTPASRTSGGFRMFSLDAVARINWIIKLQAIGFSLTEIQGFVREFEQSGSGHEATNHVREVFAAKLSGIRDSIAQLQVVENDLVEALDYLETCESCVDTASPDECGVCDHHGHQETVAPELFAGLSRKVVPFDVRSERLRRDGSRSRTVDGRADVASDVSSKD